MQTDGTQAAPQDWREALLLGRLLLEEGPTPVLVKQGRVYDAAAMAPTTSEFLKAWEPGAPVTGRDLGPLDELGLRRAWAAAEGGTRLLSPADLQCIKASGVTFAVSAIERVIEERARGDAD